jgi:anti-sigma28 factor (negative regulator of flagellin synthesis)
MKIDQPNISSANTAQGVTSNSPAGPRNTSPLAGHGDQAELSGLSKAIQSFQSGRSDRIDRLTALVRSGNYDVSPVKVSSAIVNEALSTGSQPQGAQAR